MITVLFPVGAFGSTIEYCLRKFSQELESVDAEIASNGSMHSFTKQFHPVSLNELGQLSDCQIATPVYPGYDRLDPVTTVLKIKDIVPAQQKMILIHFDTPDQVLRNHLLAWHKKTQWHYLNDLLHDKPKDWNPDYDTVADMQQYEIREALSFWFANTDNYLQVSKLARPNWLLITPDDILYNFKNTVITMLDYCNLTLDPAVDIDGFYREWFQKQQYVIEEFDTIKTIVTSLQGQSCKWAPISLMGEAIVQHCLQVQGMAIACHGLNQFPTCTEELLDIIIKEHNEH
jgi:hypothetical protein